jgi:hypothetical protein
VARRELIKLVATAVLIERDDQGRVIGELTSDPTACYTTEQLASVWAQAQVDVDAFNAAQPNRAQRRRKKEET